MNIEKANELIFSSLNNEYSVAIVVAVITFIGVVLSAILNNNFQKKINEENVKLQNKWHTKTLELQEKMNIANIDANLIANARIEWIQKVRNLSAELITVYFKILNSNNCEEIQIAFNNSIEKTELLILYFGHEDGIVQNYNFENVLNKETNVGKNELIVNFVVLLSEKFNNHNIFIQKNGFDMLEDALKKAKAEMYHNAEEVITDEQWDEFLGYFRETKEPIFNDADIKDREQKEKQLELKKQEIVALQKYLILLRNIIRIYLKIEWNKAKLAK